VVPGRHPRLTPGEGHPDGRCLPGVFRRHTGQVHVDRRTPAVLLAVFYAVCGVLAAMQGLWPMHARTPVGLLLTTGAVGVLGGIALWVFAGRVRWWVLHAGVALGSVLLALIAAASATSVGIVGLGPALIALGLYAAHFFSLRAARIHLAVLLVLASTGALVAEPTGFLIPWLALIASTVGLTEVQGRLARSLRTAASTDPLTGVANRRAWETEAARHLARAARTGEPLSFAILDLDHFKAVNDRDGHGAGDALLQELATGWSRRLRQADLLGRYGGDEFVLCLPTTDEEGAWELLGQLATTHAFAWTVGVATAQPGDTLSSLLARADTHLYRRKRNGRTTP
jgi:diguanylate cyclase (GGDEF)-like protein